MFLKVWRFGGPVWSENRRKFAQDGNVGCKMMGTKSARISQGANPRGLEGSAGAQDRRHHMALGPCDENGLGGLRGILKFLFLRQSKNQQKKTLDLMNT